MGRKAENDLRNAAHTLTLGEKCPTDTVCFHAEQCIEKYIKALLMWRAIKFRWNHDIAEMLRLLPTQDRPNLTPAECEQLTDYATVNR